MEELAQSLMSELNCETVFTVPIFGGIPMYESVLVTWIIMAFVFLLCICVTRSLKVENPGRGQIVLESAVSGLYNFFKGVMSEDCYRYIPYLMAVAVYIAIANLIGVFGFKPPTKDINVTAALSVMSIILIEFAGLRQKGMKKWLKSFAEPAPFITPINILEVFIRPLSLCMRLFGNILGGFVVMELIKLVAPVLVPLPFSFYFDIFDGCIQAYVFVFLTSLFIREAIE